MKVQILDSAKADLIEACRFYESREAGLGDYFLTNIYTDIQSLSIFGGLHTNPYRFYHRALSKRFPFAIYYTVAENRVRVHAVIDCRRHPTWIRKHLGST
ncbi:MAG: uncharacterized protein JWL81_712 [Verrucomicrobiales bacterium]|nr:uncharacterized protein [Verrucomicrobiales bacterium]